MLPFGFELQRNCIKCAWIPKNICSWDQRTLSRLAACRSEKIPPDKESTKKRTKVLFRRALCWLIPRSLGSFNARAPTRCCSSNEWWTNMQLCIARLLSLIFVSATISSSLSQLLHDAYVCSASSRESVSVRRHDTDYYTLFRGCRKKEKSFSPVYTGDCAVDVTERALLESIDKMRMNKI